MFGELVCGPPGSGKTTYCEGKRQFLSVYDPTRPVVVINLDPANEDIFPYPCDVDVRDVVCHEKVMEYEEMGPNGTYILCAAILEGQINWLVEQIQLAARRKSAEVAASMVGVGSSSSGGGAPLRPPYLLVDCPGQVEFYLNSSFMHNLFKALQKRLHCTVCTLHLVDAVVATRDIPTYVSSCLLAITTMVDHEQPHINVLTKWDAVDKEEVTTSLSEDCPYLNPSELLSENFDALWRRQLKKRRRAHLAAQYHVTGAQPQPVLDSEDRKAEEALDHVDLEKSGGRIYRYSKALLDVVDGYGLVGFVPLDVQSQSLMLTLTQQVDNAIGLLM